ncbi:dual specificity protein kinase shkC-like [Schistocerca gregaria]|uniref:dual specificity protein kinase shkC-like n=1 Tax=Schistocerca gregaria TaxID=7010 RepID=UPI00211E4DC2|nr:dual specificity protein kinase shkC-like [Schistocerca gregaria]
MIFWLEGTHLSLVGLKLGELPSFANKKHHGASIVEIVTSIDASVNRLTSVKSLRDFGRLNKFLVDYNSLDSTAFDDFPAMESLEMLWMNNNNVHDVKHYISKLAGVFPNLTHLSVLKNPGCPNLLNDRSREAYKRYRYFVISHLPKLKTLDMLPVTDEEREFVGSHRCVDLLPLVELGSSVLSSLKRDVTGFALSKQGELMVMDEREYNQWSPSYVSLGEGKMLVFQDQQRMRLESIIELKGCRLSVVEEEDLLQKVAPNLEPFKLVGDGVTRYFIADGKQQMREWMDAIMVECQGGLEEAECWEKIERERAELKFQQKECLLTSSKLRLRRTVDRAYNLSPEEVKLKTVLGHGGFGAVYEGIVRGKLVAVKVFHNQNLFVEALDEFCNEVDMLSRVRHPNIIMFMGACLEPLMIVTELMPNGTLEKLLLDTRTPLSLHTRLKMAKDAALGMSWLHESNPMILHRDFKTSNILIDDRGRVVVSDFGFSESLRKGASTWDDEGYRGTFGYASPEVMKNAVFNEKSDVYSFGIVLWQIITRQVPYPEINEAKDNAQKKKIMNEIVFNGRRPPIPSECPKPIARLIESSWDAKATNRPDFRTIVEALDCIIYEEAIPDPIARENWRSWFPNRDKVPWRDFWQRFRPAIGATTHEDKAIVRILLLPFQYENPRFTASDPYWHCQTDQVSCSDYGEFFCHFGTLDGLMDRIRRLARSPWFFGRLSAHAAFNLLYGQEAGTYLVRFSSLLRDKFIVSYVHSNRLIFHQCIPSEGCERAIEREAKWKKPSLGRPFSAIWDHVTDDSKLEDAAN